MRNDKSRQDNRQVQKAFEYLSGKKMHEGTQLIGMSMRFWAIVVVLCMGFYLLFFDYAMPGYEKTMLQWMSVAMVATIATVSFACLAGLCLDVRSYGYFLADFRFKTTDDWVQFFILVSFPFNWPFLLASRWKFCKYRRQAEKLVAENEYAATSDDYPVYTAALAAMSEERYAAFVERMQRSATLREYARQDNQLAVNIGNSVKKVHRLLGELYEVRKELAEELSKRRQLEARGLVTADVDFGAGYGRLQDLQNVLIARDDHTIGLYGERNFLGFWLDIYRDYEGEQYDLGGYQVEFYADGGWLATCKRSTLKEYYVDKAKSYDLDWLMRTYEMIFFPAMIHANIDDFAREGRIGEAVTLIQEALANFDMTFSFEAKVMNFPCCFPKVKPKGSVYDVPYTK